MTDDRTFQEYKKEFSAFNDEFKEESDRAAVVLGAAKLDIQLYHLLATVLQPSVNKDDELFEGDAPLSSTYAKTQLAFRMGLIDAAFVRALNLIRKIRNAFAHESIGCKLDAGAQHDRVKDLKLLFGDSPAYRTLQESYEKNNSPSADFRAALSFVEIRLQESIKSATRLPNISLFPLVPDGWKKKDHEPEKE